MNTRNPQEELLNRLSRAEGQIRSIRKALETGTARDCEKVLFQLKAATNALKKAGEEFAHAYVHQCMSAQKQRARMEKDLHTIISTAFTLS